MAKQHNGYKIRFVYEIRNGDGNIYHRPIGKRFPALVDVDPLRIQDAVDKSLGKIKEAAIEHLLDLHSTGHEEPHHD